MLSPAERSLSLQRNCTPVPPHTQKLTAPHLPSPDGAPCANASSSSRIFQHRLKLLPRPSKAAVLEPRAAAGGRRGGGRLAAIGCADQRGGGKTRGPADSAAPGLTPAAPTARLCALVLRRLLSRHSRGRLRGRG